MNSRIRLFKNLLQGVELDLIFHRKSDNLCEGVDQPCTVSSDNFMTPSPVYAGIRKLSRYSALKH